MVFAGSARALVIDQWQTEAIAIGYQALPYYGRSC
jgi:hypothetical protein